jgi:preprotein translocase SecF subunit
MYDRLKSFQFMKHRKIYYIFCICLIVITVGIGLVRGYNMGIDFTGGTLIQIDMGQTVEISDIESILSDNDLSGSITHAGEDNEEIIIKTADSMDSETRTTLLDALGEKYGVTDDDVLSVENIGPSVGDTLKTSAAKAVLVAIVLMLIYIAVRFMWEYGVAAIVALLNTILIVIGFYGLFHITINSPFIAAMLTILGYGINDTIVIFDRVRENTGNSTKKSVNGLEPLVDESIRQTVARSVMTSLTTVAVMIPLLIICGSTIRSFILPLLVGVIASTCSSIFIATSVWYDIARNVTKGTYKGQKKAKKQKPAKSEDKAGQTA